MARLRKRYCSMAVFLAIVAAAGFMIAGFKPVGKGLILGTLASVLNFVIQSLALPATVSGSRLGASSRSFFSLALRMFLLAIPLAVGLRFEGVQFAATVVGIFAVQIVIFVDHFVVARFFGNQDGQVD